MSREDSLRNLFVSAKRKVAPSHFEILADGLQNLVLQGVSPIRVLDIGAGSAWYWREGALSELVTSGSVALSILEPASEVASHATLSANRIQGTAPMHLSVMDDASFDVVMAFDVIEHLPKDQGFLLIYEMERISAHAAIIFTPTGWVWQPPSPNNPFNAHVSGWKPREFPKSLGWRITGHHGPKWAFGPYGIAKTIFTKHAVGKVLLEALTAITVKAPAACYAFLAVSLKQNRHSVRNQPDVALDPSPEK